MGNVIIGLTMSLDGFVEDRNGRLDPLYTDMDDFRESEVLQESIANTGAVVMGRRAYDLADGPDSWADGYEYQTPIFVLTHEPPAHRPRETDRLKFTFVTDGIESAIRQARAAAGDKDVTVVGGASTFQQCLRAGLGDILHVDIMPILLGSGLRMFEDLGPDPPQFERLRVVALPGGRTHLAYRILK